MSDYLIHYGVKGMKWGVRKDGRENWKKKESRIEARAKRREAKGHKYLAQKKEYREKKKLYDKYGVNQDFETKHTRNLIYSNGEATFKSKMVVYKDVIVKDMGGTAEFKFPNGKVQTWKYYDSEHITKKIADQYGDVAAKEFRNSYKHK